MKTHTKIRKVILRWSWVIKSRASDKKELSNQLFERASEIAARMFPVNSTDAHSCLGRQTRLSGMATGIVIT